MGSFDKYQGRGTGNRFEKIPLMYLYDHENRLLSTETRPKKKIINLFLSAMQELKSSLSEISNLKNEAAQLKKDLDELQTDNQKLRNELIHIENLKS